MRHYCVNPKTHHIRGHPNNSAIIVVYSYAYIEWGVTMATKEKLWKTQFKALLKKNFYLKKRYMNITVWVRLSSLCFMCLL